MLFVSWESFSLSLSLSLYGTMSFVSWEWFSIDMADMASCRFYHGSVSLSLSLPPSLWNYVVRIMGAFFYPHG